MKTIEQFISEQPDERPINFMQDDVSEEDCGCLLIHWGRENGLKGKLSAGMTEVWEKRDNGWLDRLVVPDFDYADDAVRLGTRHNTKTYGQLRKLLNSHP